MNKPAKPRRRGLMLVLSSPSGAGKSTLSRSLIDKENLDLSISATTRPRRRSEAEGVHYHFVDPRTFAAMRDRGELLEWAEVHGNLYGTPRAAVEAALTAGRDVLFDIDWQGTRQLAAAMPKDLVGIFVLPPSMAELRSRLERRAEDDHAVIDRRLANARAEIEHWPEYKYVLINDDLERSLDAARTILAVERGKREAPPVKSAAADRYRRDRQPELRDFVDGLLAERV